MFLADISYHRSFLHNTVLFDIYICFGSLLYLARKPLFVFSDRGVCGEVKLAIEKETCKKVALKTINKHDFPSIGVRTGCVHLTVCTLFV